MSDIDIKRLTSGITDIQSGWDTCRQLVTDDGITIEQAWAKWAAEQKQRLTRPGAQDDFIELCQAGCVPEILASIIALVRFAPRLDEFWQERFRIDERQKMTRSLEKAAEALKTYCAKFTIPGNANATKDPTKIKHDWPLSIVYEIQSHNDMWAFFDWLIAKFDVDSFVEFTKYFLVAYVKGTTGRFRDRNISALLGEALGRIDYDEVAQRMWRYRNYERLEQGLSMLFSEFLLDLSKVISRRT